MLDTSIHRNPPPKGWWLKDPTSDRKAFGFVLRGKPEGWVVYRTLKQSPAERAGVLEGDQILSVDTYSLDANGATDLLELFTLLNHDEGSGPYDLQIRRRATGSSVSLAVQTKPLRDLLAADFDLGGSSLGGCSTCLTCQPTSIGWYDCGSHPCIDRCTIG